MGLVTRCVEVTAIVLVVQLLAATSLALGAPLQTLACGELHTCSIATDRTPPVACWGGENTEGELDVPPNLPLPQHITAGATFTCVATPNATLPVYCWGLTDELQTLPPPFAGRVAQISAGSKHICALVPSASPSVVCWGDDSWNATRVPKDLSPATYIAAGHRHTCALTPSTTPPVTCWGYDTGYLLEVPANLTGVTQITAGANFTCALAPTSDPPVVCWGTLSAYNNPSNKQTGVPAFLEGAPTQLASRNLHSCALTPNARSPVTCWGANNDLQLDVPSRLGNVVQLSLGHATSCATVLGSTAQVVCWGLMDDVPTKIAVPLPLDLPTLTLGPAAAPVPAIAPASPSPNLQAPTYSGLPMLPTLSAGYNFTCAVPRNGPVTCWGDNASGQLMVPKDLTAVTHISAGVDFTCAHTPNGPQQVVCWGATLSNEGETRVPPITGTVTQVSAGVGHACALTPAAKPSVVCWGWDDDKQAAVPPNLPQATYVSAGYRHTCAVTPSTTPPVTCWGANDHGERNVPSLLRNVTQLFASENFTCAVTTASAEPVQCWGGSNSFNELIVGKELTTVPKQISVRVVHGCAAIPGGQPSVHCWGWRLAYQTDVPWNLAPATQVATGVLHTCAVTPSKAPAVSCWGMYPLQTLPPLALTTVMEPTMLDANGYPVGFVAPAPTPAPTEASGGAPVAAVLQLTGVGVLSLNTSTLLRAVAQAVGATGVSASPAMLKEKPSSTRRRLLAAEEGFLRVLLQQTAETGYVVLQLRSADPAALISKLQGTSLALPLQATPGLQGVQQVSVLSTSIVLTPISPAALPPAKKSIAPIAAGAAGGVLALIICTVIGFFLYRRHRRRTGPHAAKPLEVATSQSTYSQGGSDSTTIGIGSLEPPSKLAIPGMPGQYGPPSSQSYEPILRGQLQQAETMTHSGSLGLSSGYSGGDSGGLRPAEGSGPPRSGGSGGATSLASATGPATVWIPAHKLRIQLRPDGKPWLLGEGSYGRVYKAKLNDVEDVAAKVIKINTDMQRAFVAAEREVALLRECLSQYVVRFLGAAMEEEQGQMVVVTEFCPGGDLWHALKYDHSKEFRWFNRGRQIALDIASGLHYLHEMKNVIHFDLKSPNILLDRHGAAKIGDVGLSKILRDTTNNTISTGMGTMMWASPQQIMGEQCDFKADIWSLGIILWEICTGSENPVQARFLRELRVPEECPPEIARLSAACRNPDPSKRPTALEVYNVIEASGGGGDARRQK